MVDKSKMAYRNIRETADILGVEVHVLRFWETKFDSLRPMTRGGGRRFYSPDDIALLKTIQELLYERGLTIKAASGLIEKYGTNAIYLAPEKQNNTEKSLKALSLSPEAENKLIDYKLQLRVLEKRALADIERLDQILQKLTRVA